MAIGHWKKVLGQEETSVGDRLIASKVEPARAAKSQPLPPDLQPDLAAALKGIGIESLYTHQATAYKWSNEMNTIVTTGTASGKSLCFNLPTLNEIDKDPATRALYIYPTKALAQDQARKLAQIAGSNLKFAIYDGDTPTEERPRIKKTSNLVLTNPDMLHVGILPNHRAWGDFFKNLKVVVVDEAHVYRGVFGSHVANVLRRLRRVANLYGAEPSFILTSATIANPMELAEKLTGLDFKLIEKDGSATQSKTIAIWNPPLIDEKSWVRRSATSEAAEIFAKLVCSGVRTICFTQSRRATELIFKLSKQILEEELGEACDLIAPYRAGYTPQQRRKLERELAEGRLLGVIATSALELGIDIGELEAAVCVTFPGTVASLKQRWGRAGRSGDGLALFLAGEDALDQYFCRNPEQLLDRPVESAILDHENKSIFRDHLVCAAYEAPLEEGDEETLGPRFKEAAERLVDSDRLRRHSGRYTIREKGFPANTVSLRSASADSFDIVQKETGEFLGTVEAERAFKTVHPGAVYMHLGESYEVTDLDIRARRAIVEEFSGDYFTQPKIDTEINIEEAIESRSARSVELTFGLVSVTEQVVAYQKKSLAEREVLDLLTLDLPEQNFLTQALWFELSPEVLPDDERDLLGSLHAAEHAQIAVLPLIAMCDRWDLGGLSTNIHYQTGGATIFIYDAHPGGVGITRQGYREFETLSKNALGLISKCPCESGCPSCVQSPKCGNLNEPLAKDGAAELLRLMLVDSDTVTVEGGSTFGR